MYATSAHWQGHHRRVSHHFATVTHRTRENCQIIFSKSSVLLLLLFIVLLVMCSKSRLPPSEVTLKATFLNLMFPRGISLPFYVYASAHRRSILIIVQRDATKKQSIYYSASSFYMYRVSTTPIIRSGQAWPRWREVAAQKIWPVPEAVVTVLCTPDDGCCWHPKHVNWACRIIIRLLCVASRWTIINIYHCRLLPDSHYEERVSNPGWGQVVDICNLPQFLQVNCGTVP